MEKDLSHRIRDAMIEGHLDMVKRLVRYMSFKNETPPKKLTEGMSERGDRCYYATRQDQGPLR